MPAGADQRYDFFLSRLRSFVEASTVLSREESPRRGRTGYFCKLCLDYFRETNPGEEFTKFFASRDGVWINDIFEPFLN